MKLLQANKDMSYKKTLTVLVIMIISGFLNASNTISNRSFEQDGTTTEIEKITTKLYKLSTLPSDTREQRVEGVAEILSFLSEVSSQDIHPQTEAQTSRKMERIIIRLDELSLLAPRTIEEKLKALKRIINFPKTLPSQNLLPIPSDIREWKIIILCFFRASRSQSSITLPSNNREKEIILERITTNLLNTLELPLVEEDSSLEEVLLLLIGLNQLSLLPSDVEENRVELIKRATENFLNIVPSQDLLPGEEPVPQEEMRQTAERSNQEMVEIILRLNQLSISSLDVPEKQLKALITVLSFLNRIPFECLEGRVKASQAIRRIIMRLDESMLLLAPRQQRGEEVTRILTEELALLNEEGQ